LGRSSGWFLGLHICRFAEPTHLLSSRTNAPIVILNSIQDHRELLQLKIAESARGSEHCDPNNRNYKDISKY